MSKYTETELGIASRNYDRGDVRIATFPQGVPVAKVKRLPGNSWEIAHKLVKSWNLHNELVAALKGVVRVADRKTCEFDAARAVLARVEAE